MASYTLQFCKANICSQTFNVARNQFGRNSQFSSEYELEECSKYTVQAPDIKKDMKEKLSPVTAEAGNNQMITIKWFLIKCAPNYEVLQKQNIVGRVPSNSGVNSVPHLEILNNEI